MSSQAPGARFDLASLAGLDEPVRRYLAHAIDDGALIPESARLSMLGRIKVGRWLSFTARQTIVGHNFEWAARAGIGRLRPLSVVDVYSDGRGSTDGRVGRLHFLHADDENTARSAAVRAAIEAIWFPTILLPQCGTAWRADSDDRIVASMSIAPEQPEIALRIGVSGALREVSSVRWGNVGQRSFGYIPFGGIVEGERRFGSFVIPSKVSVGWWFGTPRFAPFFRATVTEAVFNGRHE